MKEKYPSDAELTLARQHIASAEKLVREQIARMDHASRRGWDMKPFADTLLTMRRSLDLMREHLFDMEQRLAQRTGREAPGKSDQGK